MMLVSDSSPKSVHSNCSCLKVLTRAKIIAINLIKHTSLALTVKDFNSFYFSIHFFSVKHNYLNSKKAKMVAKRGAKLVIEEISSDLFFPTL